MQEVLPMQGKSSADSVRVARTCVINQVLGTDMKKHFDIVSRFQVSFLPSQCAAVGPPSLAA